MLARRAARGRGRLAALAASALALTLLAACQQAPPASQRAAGNGGTVVVASFNFPESELLAAIYGLAIRNAGIPVRLELGLGPRELVRPALEQGLADLVPEYVGTALNSMQPGARVAWADPAAVRNALAVAFAGWHIQVLTPAAAQDQNAVVVTRATAARLHLRTVSDLRRVAGRLTIGGTPECPKRPYCLPGLRSVYGLEFAAFEPFDTLPQRVTALLDGVVDVAMLTTTDGNHNTTTDTYDGGNRVVSEVLTDSHGTALTSKSFTYDPNGHVTAASSRYQRVL